MAKNYGEKLRGTPFDTIFGPKKKLRGEPFLGPQKITGGTFWGSRLVAFLGELRRTAPGRPKGSKAPWTPYKYSVPQQASLDSMGIH